MSGSTNRTGTSRQGAATPVHEEVLYERPQPRNMPSGIRERHEARGTGTWKTGSHDMSDDCSRNDNNTGWDERDEDALQDEFVDLPLDADGDFAGARSFFSEMKRPAGEDESRQAVPVDDNDNEIGADDILDDEFEDMPSYDELLEENERLRAQVRNVVVQYNQLKDDWANFRRRAEVEAERTKSLASERVATQIIPVIDDIRRSINHLRSMSDEFQPLADGNEAIASRIVAALDKEGIEVIVPDGEPFDANRHQAIDLTHVDGMEPGLVYKTYQEGYAIGERVIRPAIVGVTK